MILDPFFKASRELASDSETESKFYLGFRLKSPGMDLVLFRHDGDDVLGKPKGHGAIFHYAGFVPGNTASIPKLLSVNNIRNSFLFEVSKNEFQAAESFIDMLRENGVRNPYYFSRSLSPSLDRERNLQKPMRFDGSTHPDYVDDLCDHFSMPSTSIPAVAINCAYLAIEIVQTIVGIKLEEIHPSLPDANTGDKYKQTYDAICRSMEQHRMPEGLDRNCIVFDEDGKHKVSYSKHEQGYSSIRLTVA